MIAGKSPGAYYHAGFAYECALKGRIMRNLRLNSWPGGRQYRVHDLTSLASLSGDLPVLETLASEGHVAIGLVWLVAKDWQPGLRYTPTSRFPDIRATDMMRGLLEGGLLEWLMA